MFEPVTVSCQECRIELAADSPELRLELTCDDEPLVSCVGCWKREFGERDPLTRTGGTCAAGALRVRLSVPTSWI
jgi:hypothetical protein